MMELEFIALAKVTEEVKWLCQFLEDIPRWLKPVSAITINSDSQSVIGRTQSNMYNSSLDMFVVNIIPLDDCSQVGLLLLTL